MSMTGKKVGGMKVMRCMSGRVGGFRRGARLVTATSLMVLLAACAIQPEPFTQADFAAKAAAQHQAIVKDVEPIARPLTLAESVARAVKYNFDARVRMMEQAQALGQLDVARWDLMPKLAANAGYNVRSEPNATRSRNLYSQTTSATEPTYSADRDAITADLTATWNLLDFGVGYFNAKNQADRALIASERRRKTLHTLTQDVRAAWWRAASAQKLKDQVAATLAQAENALADSRKAEDAAIRNPIETLRYQRTLIDTIRQLETIEQQLSTARTELAVLIGVPPSTPFTIAVPDDDGLVAPQWTIPIDKMEEQALHNNPDLHETAYNQRISLQDTRKAIVRLLPGISLTTGRNYDSNSFLMANKWYEAGATVTWNLLNVFSGPAEIEAAEANESVMEARALAMHMAVLSQAHIAVRQFDVAVKQFERASQIHAIDKRILDHSTAREAADAQGELDRISNNTTMIFGLLRRYESLSQVHASLGRIQATLGIDPIPDRVAGIDVDTLTQAIGANMARFESGRGEQPEAKPGVAVQAKPVVVVEPAIPSGPVRAGTVTEVPAGDQATIWEVFQRLFGQSDIVDPRKSVALR
jgi:outer membrane protein TolC